MRTWTLSLCLTIAAAAGCKKKQSPSSASGAPGAGASAAAEASPTPAARALTRDDAAALIDGEIRAMPLAGIAESDGYSSQRYFPTSGSEYGVAVQLFLLGKDAEARYLKDLGSYPQAQAKDEVGDRSFRAYRDGIEYLHFLDKGSGIIVSVTCDIGACSPKSEKTAKPEELRWETIVGLAKTAQGRLGAVAKK